MRWLILLIDREFVFRVWSSKTMFVGKLVSSKCNLENKTEANVIAIILILYSLS